MKDLKWVNPHTLKGYNFQWEKAFRYAKLMENGEDFPPVRVHETFNGELVIKNGMHRVVAAKLCGKEILVEVASRDEMENWDIETSFKRR